MNVLDLLKEDGIAPKHVSGNKGGEFHSPCPGCGGRDRFHCWPEQNRGQGSWWCRVCDQGGDNIQYLIDYRGMAFKDAAIMCGRELKGGNSRSRQPLRAPCPRAIPERFTPRSSEAPASLWQKKAGQLVEWAHRQLLRSPGQLDYLAKRGISLEGVKAFRLGFNPGERGRDVYRARSAWGLPRATKDDGSEKKLWLPRGIVIPYFLDGQLHRVRIRRPDPRKFGPKYYVVPGSCMAPMFIRPKARAFVVVEAELDAMLCALAAPDSVGAVGLGSLGTKPDERGDHILRQSVCILNALDIERIAPVDDSEKARTEAEKKERLQRRLRDWWQATYDQAERWPVPQAKDPGEAFEKGEDLRAWIMSGLPPVLTFGASNSGLAYEGEGLEEKSATLGQLPALEVPNAVREFHDLLQGTPVCFEKRPDGGCGLTYPPKWARENWELFRNISERIWASPVFDWLDEHPASLIGAENLFFHCKK